MSITDPGNTEAVFAVGATHRPATQLRVSYFSGGGRPATAATSGPRRAKITAPVPVAVPGPDGTSRPHLT
jgi:hypothetical protein